VYAQPAGFATPLQIMHGTLILRLEEGFACTFVLLNKENALIDIDLLFKLGTILSAFLPTLKV
jgi:hypothetical protein